MPKISYELLSRTLHANSETASPLSCRKTGGARVYEIIVCGMDDCHFKIPPFDFDKGQNLTANRYRK